MENLKSIINEEESKLTDRSDSERPRYEDYIPLRSSSQDSRENDAFSSQIDSLRKQSQAVQDEDSRKTTASPKNNFADASTSNGSETEEKFDSKKAVNNNKLEKSNKEAPAAYNDEWAFLEESENKVSKSSKKRQKRKLKKKAIQESLKAQEEQSKSELDDVTSPKADDIIVSKENNMLNPEDTKANPSPISVQNEKETQEATNSNGNSRKGSESEKSSAPEEIPKSSWKEDSTLKNPSFPINPQEFDDFGFIEVKAKKKTEKEKKAKGKKDGKESWRKNKEKEPVEKKRPPREAPKAKPVVTAPAESTRKTTNNMKPEKISTVPIQKVVTTIEKTVEGGQTKPKNKETTKVSLIIPSATAVTTTKPKVLTPPSLKTAVSNPPASASGSASESETTSCTSKEVSQTSTSSNVNASENNNHHHNHHASHSAPKSGQNVKGHKVYHPLSLTSPSLDPETIRIAKVKEYANEFFNKKFKNDIFKHVSDLTEGSNTIMKYRILAYQRLDYCIAKLFPSKIFNSNGLF